MKTDSIINFLAGTYAFLNNTQLRDGVQVATPWGSNPSGLLTYTRYGYMLAVINSNDPEVRPANLTWPPKDTDSVEDWALVGRTSLSYAGPFSLNTSVPLTKYSGQIIHGPLATASVPYLFGQAQRRNYTVIEQDGAVYLSISVITTQPGVRSELWWKRIVKG
ncbi:hypothetical protein OQA88_2563 [Cercophora sp. LCS_1]